VAEAAAAGAEWVALPEMFAYLRREGNRFPCAQGLDGEIVGSLREMSRRHQIWLLGGSFPEAVLGDERVYNTSVLVSPQGEVTAAYRKIHLFDVDLGEHGGGRLQESASIAPGEDLIVARTPFGAVGLSICYDLRFPELYRYYSYKGCQILTVPSAFTEPTGKAHWETLLRARAIENQCYVLAAAQNGTHPGGRQTWGHSMIVDPWGEVLSVCRESEGIITADIELGRVGEVRQMLPALSHRRM